jgi:hypothetical protein
VLTISRGAHRTSANWTNVTQILSGRLLRVGAQLDF